MSKELNSLGDYKWREQFAIPPSPGEQAFLDAQLRRLRQIESRARGLYCEARIASLLGDEVHDSVLASSPWDLCWKNLTISIRASGRYNNETQLDENHQPVKCSTPRWGFKKKFWWNDTRSSRRTATDIVVLGFHDGTKIDDGWGFIPITGKSINSLEQDSIGEAKALELAGLDAPLPPEELSGSMEDLRLVLAGSRKRPNASTACKERRFHTW